MCAAGEWPGSRHEDGYQKHIRSTHGRGEKNVHYRFSDTDQHAHTPSHEPRGER